MTKERKNIITRESCQKDLKHVVTAGFKYSLVVLAAVLFFLLPISLIVGATTWFLSIFALVFVAVLIHNILRLRMVNQGRFETKVLSDGWTVKTKDGKLACHYENTVLITDGNPEILTDCE